jgi:hypothetical protein
LRERKKTRVPADLGIRVFGLFPDFIRVAARVVVERLVMDLSIYSSGCACALRESLECWRVG